MAIFRIPNDKKSRAKNFARHISLKQPTLFFKVLANTLPLGEFELEVLVVEEESRLTYTALELPVEPLNNSLGIVATVLLVVGTTVTIL